jgi:glycosyltransferase involved in cell wall biosynthesis
MKIIQLCNLPIEDVYQQICFGETIDRHNVLYGYDYLQEHGVEVIPISHYKKTILTKIVNQIGCFIWGGHADYYLQVKAIRAAYTNDVNLIYCHFLHITPLISFCRKIGIVKYPLVVVCHDAFSQKTTSIKNWEGIDRILSLCENTFELCKIKEDISKFNCGFIDWGADVDLCDKFYSLQKEPSKSQTIVATGIANRDYDTLVSAMSEIDNLNLNILSSNCFLNVEQPKNVIIDRNMGRSSTSKVLPFYYDAIATAIPLKDNLDFANGGTILMESMAMRRPVIITSLRANLVSVEKEKIGFEVDFGDIKGWKEAILYLKEHPEEAKEMGERAYFLAKTRYSYNNYCKQIFFEIEKYK